MCLVDSIRMSFKCKLTPWLFFFSFFNYNLWVQLVDPLLVLHCIVGRRFKEVFDATVRIFDNCLHFLNIFLSLPKDVDISLKSIGLSFFFVRILYLWRWWWWWLLLFHAHLKKTRSLWLIQSLSSHWYFFQIITLNLLQLKLENLVFDEARKSE